MAKLSPLTLLPPVIFAVLAGVFYFGMFRDNPDELPSVLVGQPAPAMEMPALDGRGGFTPADLTTGEVTVVNFWASWCPPCRAEHPTLHALRDEGVRLFGVNFKDKAAQANRYLNGDGDPFLGVAYDPAGRLAIEWGVTAPPETFIIGGDGTVLFRFVGPLVGSDYEQRFRPALERALAGGQGS